MRLLSSPKDSVAAVGRMISSNLKEDEVRELLPLIPELKAIINSHASDVSKTSHSHGNIKQHRVANGQERWKNAFRRLSGALNAAYSPLVICKIPLQLLYLLHVINSFS